MKTLTQRQISTLLRLVNSASHSPNRDTNVHDIANIHDVLTEASKASGPMIIVGEASYQELEASLEEAVIVAAPRLEGSVDRPVAYTLIGDGSETRFGPFPDLAALRDDLRERGFADEMVAVGPWVRQGLRAVGGL